MPSAIQAEEDLHREICIMWKFLCNLIRRAKFNFRSDLIRKFGLGVLPDPTDRKDYNIRSESSDFFVLVFMVWFVDVRGHFLKWLSRNIISQTVLFSNVNAQSSKREPS